MKTITLFFLVAIIFMNINAQNIFPVKLTKCNSSRFCLDCGDTKVSYSEKDFDVLIQKLNETLLLNGITGVVKFQVLVDSMGQGCVLSHSDQTNNAITKIIIKELNKFDKWNPAITNGTKEEKTSITLVFTIKGSRISGYIERVDLKAFKKSFDRPTNPEIFNKTYNYKNENLPNYIITVWNSKNSNLPNNMNDYITIDKNGLIWLSIDEGLVTFDGKNFRNAEQNITDKGKFFSYYAIATDNNNIKWVYGTKNIYSFDNENWIKYDTTEIGIDKAYKIVNNPATGEVFFCSDKGLTILRNGIWSNINKQKIKELPSNTVAFAKRDLSNRIWIGTYSGSVMIDSNGEVTNFENSKTILKGKTITSMDEDENGNLYFTLYEFDRNEKQKVINDEGLAIRYTDGSFKQFTTENSGMPINHSNCVLYDRNEKVLWISTYMAGLIRYDLKDGWENYHNENSEIPTSYITSMIFDQEGNLYLSTRQGLVKIERK